MNKLVATFRIVTPMFLGGAEPKVTAELRAQSFKGVLRFWWRAISYATYDGDIKKLADQENRLFGSTDGACPFQLHLHGKERLVARRGGDNLDEVVRPERPGARYLGFGLMDAFSGKNTTAGKLMRGCINHNQEFSLTAISRTHFPESLIDAFKLFGLLGGMGSRSRKGFGSLTLDQLKINSEKTWEKPDTPVAYKT